MARRRPPPLPTSRSRNTSTARSSTGWRRSATNNTRRLPRTRGRITMRYHHARRRANVTASQKVVSAMKIRLKVGATPLNARLLESKASRDFASLLPLTLTMNDLFRREKYGHLPRPISEEGRRAHTYEVGQIAYWAPGPDVAIYYRQDGQPIPDPGIVVPGTINCGVEAFDVPGATRVTIELVK